MTGSGGGDTETLVKSAERHSLCVWNRVSAELNLPSSALEEDDPFTEIGPLVFPPSPNHL